MKIKDYLKQNDMSVDEFAHHCGLSVPAVYNYIRGRLPSFRSLKAIADGTNGKVSFKDFAKTGDTNK